MKKSMLSLIALGLLISGAWASLTPPRKIPRTIQGVEVSNPETQTGKLSTTDYEWADPDDLKADGSFTFDMIQNWSGEGSNQAALVIQWNDSRETAALVFGYRWDGVATGADMIRAVVANNPRLYTLIQYTNVSSPTDPNGGYTINGFGWDADNDGDIALKDTGHNNQIYTSEDGVFIHPRGYVPGQGGSSDYDYDNWLATDDGDLWGAGWYISYWSYWVKGSADSKFGYSGWGASGRVLENGCWDGWNFALNMYAPDFKPFVSAPALIPEGAKTLFEHNGIQYSLVDYSKSTVALIPSEGVVYSGDITIPQSFHDSETDKDYTVVEIKDEAFKNSTISSVIIPSSVTKIGNSAFEGSSLATIQGADNVSKIGVKAFRNCVALKTVVIPEGTTQIPEALYENTAIEILTMPAGISTIGNRAFASCSELKSINLPEGIVDWGTEVFAECDNITGVQTTEVFPTPLPDGYFSENAFQNATVTVPLGYTDTYKSISGWKNFVHYSEEAKNVSVGDMFMLDGVTFVVTSIEDPYTVAVTHCKSVGEDNNSIREVNATGYEGELRIPAIINYQGKTFEVSAIEKSAFYGASNLLSLIIDAGIQEIPDYAFYDCTSLNSISLPSTVQTIGTYAFSYCSALDRLQLPDNLTTLGDRCFFQCTGLESLTVPQSVTAIPNNCFSYCTSLKEMILSDNITSFGSTVFQNCKALEKVRLPESLKKIPSSTFDGCVSLSECVLPAGITEIGSTAFRNCKALKILIPETVTQLGSSAFQGCVMLNEVSVPEGVTSLPSYIFQDCSALKSVSLPATLTTIGYGAFTNCKALTTISINNESDVQEGTIHLPVALSSFGGAAFKGCSSIRSVTMPDAVKTIPASIFENASSLQEITLSPLTASIATTAFSGTALKTLVIPAAVKSYSGSNLVYGCQDIKVYICNPTPTTLAQYIWRTISSPLSYADLYVPFGSADAYLAKNYWNKSNIKAPVLTSVSAECKYATEVISGNITDVVYDLENLPFAYKAECDKQVYSSSKVQLRNDSSDIVEGETTISNEGNFSFEIDGKAGDKYEIVLVNGNSSYVIANIDTAEAPFHFSERTYQARFDEQFTPELVFDNDNYSIADVTFTSDNTAVASVNSRTGMVTVKRMEGTATIKASLKTDNSVFAELAIESALRTPVTSFKLGNGSKEISLTELDIMALCPVVEPVDADVQTYDIEISDSEIATTYSVTAFNPTRKFFELVTHRSGEFDLTFRAQDGSDASSTYHVVVSPLGIDVNDNFTDGTFWLNEDWFGHTNGSINYISKDYELNYRVYGALNPGESFGCTSQYGIIHGDKLIVMSKQADDKGDPRPGGGRVVIADAKTLHKLASFDEIGGDGRACVGAGAGKVYLGTTGGIRILYSERLELGELIEGIPSGSLYASQPGDMVQAGKYVFVIRQNTGVYAIDIDTDKVVAFYDSENSVAYPQGITQTSDGTVWVASTEKASGGKGYLVAINPETLDVESVNEMPDGMRVTCGWGSWRSTNFFASRNENALWWGSGVDNQIYSGNTGYYKWDCTTPLSELEPIFVFPKNLQGIDEKTMQAPYGSVRYDDRTDHLLVAATHGSSSNYRYTWLHFVDCKSGEIDKTIRMKDYYWFPAIPIFPDKHAPMFAELPTIELSLENDAAGYDLDLTDIVSDADNHDFNIRLSLLSREIENKSQVISLFEMTDEDSDNERKNAVIDAELDGRTLTLTPLTSGQTSLTLVAESNGKTTQKAIPVTVKSIDSGIASPSSDGSICIVNKTLYIRGHEGETFIINDLSGRARGAFIVSDNEFRIDLALSEGIYLLQSDKSLGHSFKFIIK
ncbi:MAG: leucine-rich repeat protein [Muribaculaceae bacterium]|nr:leucine-rich repeat protein [Muribaculaceae bacterium]